MKKGYRKRIGNRRRKEMAEKVEKIRTGGWKGRDKMNSYTTSP